MHFLCIFVFNKTLIYSICQLKLMPAYYINPNTDPYHNMAVEEFMFHHFDEPVFHLWQNEPSVVIGRNQLPEAEVDMVCLQKKNIKLVRRFSGGGAVYQDLGNINLSFINSDRNLDFDSMNLQIMEFLRTLGLTPTTNERRAIFIDEKKISGSSQFIRGQKAIYHVTLLYSANLDNLENSLRGNTNILLLNKHVKSVRSTVTNLSSYFPEAFSVENFKERIAAYFIHQNDKSVILTDEFQNKIQQLKDDKYTNNVWILNGKSK